jgi:N-acetyl-1-D-myo-inositol-2-amino-2-deoxy-alpha-D-glucopyranoside deacetylase
VERSSGRVAGLAGETILAIFAHPDDESLACGGTLARLADAGARVILFCATRGERGGPTGPVRDDRLALVRVQELRCAAAALGIAEVILMDHPDGELRWERVPEFQAEIIAAVRRYRPRGVITFGADGLYWHGDHIGVYERTTTALRSLGPAAPPVYHVTLPRGIIRPLVEAALSRGWAPPLKGFWSLIPDAFGLHALPPTVIVDVQPWVAQKVAAILCHKTQMGSGHPFDQLEAAEAERWLGTEHFHRVPGDVAQPAVLELIGSRPQTV